MSRNIIFHDKNTTIVNGVDHVLGNFVDVLDERYANSGFDVQGEGFVLEWCTNMGFLSNLIGITESEVQSPNAIEIIKEKTEAFITKMEGWMVTKLEELERNNIDVQDAQDFLP